MSNAFASNLDTNAQSTIEEEQSRVSTIEQLVQPPTARLRIAKEKIINIDTLIHDSRKCPPI